MVHETIQGTFRQTNLTNESAEYLGKREELRLAEIELMRHRERVAELRRHLPPGPAVEDYKFIEGPVDLDTGDTPTRTVRLSELFTAAGRPLAIYHLMYGKLQTKPCPMCTAWIDGINGVTHQISQNVDLEAKTGRAIRIPRFRSSHGIVTAPFTISTRRIHGCLRRSRSAA